MGIYKFKFSNMIPNTWFYKLKDMKNRIKDTTNKIKTQSPKSTTTTHQPKNHHPQFFTNSRHSYYISTDSFKSEKLHNSPLNPKSNDTQFPPLNPARKSSKRRRRRSTKTTIKSPSLRISTIISTSKNPSSPFENSSSDYLINDICEFILTELESDPHSVSDPFESQSSWSSSCKFSSSATDIIIDMDDNDSSNQNLEKFNGFDLISELELPPILTKPRKFSNMVSGNRKKEAKPVQFRTDPLSVKVVNGGTEKTTSKEQKMGMGNSYRRSTSSSRERIRSKSPKKSTRKTPKYSRKLGVSCIKKNSRSLEKKNVSDSFAVVKCSFDPQRDFRESMVEMILENNIRASKDLEELLACYLTLNSNEYHDLIVKVFEQIWFDLTNSKL